MNQNIFYKGQVFWAQIDANRHLRHSAYADFCAQARSNMLTTLGLSLGEFAIRKIGPILFREELKYYREVKLDEYIEVGVELTKLDQSNSRFSFRHLVYNAKGVVAAEVNVDGAWLDLASRKLTTIPSEWSEILDQVPRSGDFVEIKN